MLILYQSHQQQLIYILSDKQDPHREQPSLLMAAAAINFASSPKKYEWPVPQPFPSIHYVFLFQ